MWGGIQPPVVYSVIALHLQGYPLDHPVMRAALAGLEDFVIRDDRGRRLEACQSPVWDTALAIWSPCRIPAPARTTRRPGRRRPSGWRRRRSLRQGRLGGPLPPATGFLPAGWAFEFANDNYPDIDDTAEVVLALRRTRPATGPSGARGCAPAAVAWTIGMQCADGGWAAFDVDNDSRLIAALPFCDFGEVTDPPSADVTAHVIEMLADEPGVPPDVLQRGLDWLWREQEAGRVMVRTLGGQLRLRHRQRAVPALIRAGVAPDDPRIRRPPSSWLEEHQNPDGGWGEDMRSYIDPSWRGRGAYSTCLAETAWAPPGASSPRARRTVRSIGWPGGAWTGWVASQRRRRQLGRALVHRHRVSLGLQHQLPPLPPGLAGHGPRPVRAGPNCRGRRTMNEPILTVLAPLRVEARAMKVDGSGAAGQPARAPDCDQRRGGGGGGATARCATHQGRRPVRWRWPASPAPWSKGSSPALWWWPTGSWTRTAARSRPTWRRPRWWPPTCGDEGSM